MKRTILFLVLCTAYTSSHAEKGKSIMFGDQDPLYRERMKDTSADDQAAYCKSLRQRINSLSLRPLSRNAAIQRYQLECGQGQPEQRPGLAP